MDKPDQCCVVCDAERSKDFDIKDPLVLLIKAAKQLQQALQGVISDQAGVSETKLIGWIRGAKQDWLAAPDLQPFLDSSDTYAQGQTIAEREWSKGTWECLLRQGVKLG